MPKYALTPEGLERLKSEVDLLEKERVVIGQIKGEAAALGDRSESSEYQDASERQRNNLQTQVDRKRILAYSQVIDIKSRPIRNIAEFGTYVYLLPIKPINSKGEENQPRLFRIVGLTESDDDLGYLYYMTPVCRQFLNKPVLSKVTLDEKATEPDYEIAAVFYDPERFAFREFNILKSQGKYDYHGPRRFDYLTKDEIIREIIADPTKDHGIRLPKSMADADPSDPDVIWVNAKSYFANDLQDILAKQVKQPEQVETRAVDVEEQARIRLARQMATAQAMAIYLVRGGNLGNCLSLESRNTLNRVLKAQDCTIGQIKSFVPTLYNKLKSNAQHPEVQLQAPFDSELRRLEKNYGYLAFGLKDFPTQPYKPDYLRIIQSFNELARIAPSICPDLTVSPIILNLPQELVLDDLIKKVRRILRRTETADKSHPDYWQFDSLLKFAVQDINNLEAMKKRPQELVRRSKDLKDRIDNLKSEYGITPTDSDAVLPDPEQEAVRLQEEATQLLQWMDRVKNVLTSQVCPRKDVNALLDQYQAAEQAVSSVLSEGIEKTAPVISQGLTDGVCTIDQMMAVLGATYARTAEPRYSIPDFMAWLQTLT